MTIAYRLAALFILPLAFFGAGILTAAVATKAAKLIAPEPATLLDAVAAGDGEAIFRMVSAGNDPGLPVVLDRRLFEWQQGDVASPLLVAIVNGELNQVAYLARQTQRLAEPPNDAALCVAARYGHTHIARLLMKMAAPAVPKNGCGEAAKPEEIAAKYGSDGLAKELRRYRLGEAD